MWKFSVPDNILDKLRCSLCKDYLSQLPVYIYPGQEGNVCGRCPVLSEKNPIRDVTYETLASCLYFPCRFKSYGCLDSFLLQYIKAHEDSCSYKQYFCPFIPLASCPWQGPSHELISHYQDHHAELLLNEPTFEVDLINMYENNYLLEKDNEIFLIHSKCENCDCSENSFWCQIRYVGNKNMANKFTYEVRLKKNNSLERVTLTKKVVGDDTSTTLDKYTAVHVKLADISKALGDPCSVLCEINILPNEVVTEDSIDLGQKIPLTNLSPEDVDIHTDILMELECPVCTEFMVPPIYQCVVGHIICAVCKVNVHNCPTCRQNILDTRNFSLENLTRFVKYHCKYRDFDCPFVSSSTEIKSHESSCKYGPYACPLDEYNECKWKGKLVDVMNHVRLTHEDNVFDCDTLSFETNESDDVYYEHCFVKNVHQNVFKLHFKYEEEVFYWCMQYVGPSDEAKEYKFELDFCDDSYLNQRLYIRRECCNLLPYEETFTNASCITFSLDLMRPFFEKGNLVYKCHIIKT